MDKEGGIALDDCANISNQLGDIFDIRDVIKGAYTLEVSSPGLEEDLSGERIAGLSRPGDEPPACKRP